MLHCNCAVHVYPRVDPGEGLERAVAPPSWQRETTNTIDMYLYTCISSTVNLEIFMYKNFRLKNFRSLTPLWNYLYSKIFLTKELVHASSIRSTTAEEYQRQSKQARSRLPHEANN